MVRSARREELCYDKRGVKIDKARAKALINFIIFLFVCQESEGDKKERIDKYKKVRGKSCKIKK